jgi:hypothetical protein
LILFRDVVTKGIYHRFQKRNKRYFMLIDIEDETIVKSLGTDLQSAQSSFSYFNMLFCATYDTDGKDEYLKFVDEYLGATLIRRLSKEEAYHMMYAQKHLEEKKS